MGRQSPSTPLRLTIIRHGSPAHAPTSAANPGSAFQTGQQQACQPAAAGRQGTDSPAACGERAPHGVEQRAASSAASADHAQPRLADWWRAPAAAACSPRDSAMAARASVAAFTVAAARASSILAAAAATSDSCSASRRCTRSAGVLLKLSAPAAAAAAAAWQARFCSGCRVPGAQAAAPAGAS